ncbi:pantoate--beta-alanine ligase [Fistulifera solaris]|uniref:Pantoate--beta-alanine ligase n=1 Tax=Fistulifera solaris TaxID=1519565 RepID=A0A1Z5JY74_FISSO|nr:pantoate--beta-alanine ligase [Fistulifera solaris]|eukprot:GAX18995.1 pantoate--beta-alanine ligase [Fistulifera solaris]
MTTAAISLHRTIASFRSVRRAIERTTKIGFVPTMGALHEGHLTLVRQARAENDVVVASIFVNPTQFGPNEDFEKYPRQLQIDSDKLAALGVDYLFAPSVNDMYGKDHVTYVDPEGFDDTSEGKSRPGHFRGVATIVTKLFNIVQPTNAYFGQKDAAQCVLIRRIVDDLNMDVNVIVADTVRESDGLAMSSRNTYLTPTERRAAPIVYQSLCAARTLVLASESAVESAVVRETVESVLRSEPLISEIQYVSIDNKSTMQSLEQVNREDGALISLACKLGSVRLIDNIII